MASNTVKLEIDVKTSSIIQCLREVFEENATLRHKGILWDWVRDNGASIHCNFCTGPEEWSVTPKGPHGEPLRSQHGETIEGAISKAREFVQSLSAITETVQDSTDVMRGLEDL